MQWSQNGWVASPDRNAIGVKNYIIAGTNRHIAVATAVAPIFGAFLAEFNLLIEKIDGGTYDDWGHNFAHTKVGDGSVLSNHASGTAVDINALRHAQGKRNTFAPIKRVRLLLLCKKYGIRGGLSYKHTPDDMHFEIIETPVQVKARIAKMKLPIPKVRK